MIQLTLSCGSQLPELVSPKCWMPPRPRRRWPLRLLSPSGAWTGTCGSHGGGTHGIVSCSSWVGCAACTAWFTFVLPSSPAGSGGPPCINNFGTAGRRLHPTCPQGRRWRCPLLSIAGSPPCTPVFEGFVLLLLLVATVGAHCCPCWGQCPSPDLPLLLLPL